MNEYLPTGRPTVGEEDTRRVRDALRSEWLTQGPRVVEFEAGLVRLCGARHAVAVAHAGTGAYLACRAAGLGPGDRFLASPISDLAMTNAGLLCGAEPIFADIDPASFNLDAELVARVLAKDRKIKVVLAPHLGGRVCELELLAEACAERGVVLIEDGAQALGGSWLSRDGVRHPVGDGAFSAMTCVGFDATSAVTTGEGGAILTNDDVLADRLRLLRNQGVTRNPARVGESREPWHYEMRELAPAGSLTEFQAALGCVQLEKLPRLKRRRLELVRRYDEALTDLDGVTCQQRPADDDSCWHLMLIRTRGRTGLYEHLLRHGIRTAVHHVPVHTQPYYQEHFGTRRGDYPEAEKYSTKALTLPLYPDLTDEEQDRVIAAVREFHRAGDDD